jgi:hypothetical protein
MTLASGWATPKEKMEVVETTLTSPKFKKKKKLKV